MRPRGPDEWFRITRPLIWGNEYFPDVPFSTHGTGTIVRFRDVYYAVITGHSLMYRDVEDLLIPFSSQSGDIIPLRHMVATAPLDDNDVIHADIRAFMVEPLNGGDDEWHETEYYEIDRIPRRPPPKDRDFVAIGHPHDVNFVDYQKKVITNTRVHLDCSNVEHNVARSCHRVTALEPENVGTFQGFSGGAVLSFGKEEVCLEGIIVQGSKESRMFTFVDICFIRDLLLLSHERGDHLTSARQ